MRNAGVLVSIDVAVWARNPSASMTHGFVPSRGGTEFDTDPDALVTVPAFVWLGYHTGIPQADVVEIREGEPSSERCEPLRAASRRDPQPRTCTRCSAERTGSRAGVRSIPHPDSCGAHAPGIRRSGSAR